MTDFVRRKLERSDAVLKTIWRSLPLLLLPLMLLRPAPARAAEYLTASGCSVSNVGYLAELAAYYEKRTGMKVFVRGGGSVVGIEDLKSGKVDFAASCRIRDAGDPPDIDFVQVAWDALVFIVNKANPIDTITLDDVRLIYAGRTTNWKQLKGGDAPIKVFISRTRRGLSGVESSTRQMVLNGKEPAETANTVSVASSAIVEQMVEENPDGFATTGITSARKRNVKILRVNGVAPTNKTIINGRYPLKRPLYLLVPKNAKPEVKKFVAFALGREGQRFIRSLQVISVLDVQ